jgi:hypothetical protein
MGDFSDFGNGVVGGSTGEGGGESETLPEFVNCIVQDRCSPVSTS